MVYDWDFTEWVPGQMIGRAERLRRYGIETVLCTLFLPARRGLLAQKGCRVRCRPRNCSCRGSFRCFTRKKLQQLRPAVVDFAAHLFPRGRTHAFEISML
jgi:hypothetical protein